MATVVPGIGTAVNVATVLLGSSLGLLLGARLPTRTRDTVTDALGLVTLLIGGLSAARVTSASLSAAVGSSAPVLIVLGALLLGGIAGSLLDIEARLEGFGGWLRIRLAGRRSYGRRGVSAGTLSAETPAADVRGGVPPASAATAEFRTRTFATDARTDIPAGTLPAGTETPDVPAGTLLAASAGEHAARERFIEGFVTASLIFCVGPLTILGSLSDGLGRGPDQLILKAVLDGFASIAFAASLGVGVMVSVIAIVLVQGSLTLVGVLVGDVLPDAHVMAITATGGLLLLGVGLRLLKIKQVPVGNLLPALFVAPALVWLVAALR